ncbi:Bem46-like serine peptidase [Trypanosoma rangeli]|uniref:Bem46-like serine peptidase n=1 Tax=Trypanosoma rangeli TaxID=5698 RepID=A0A3R7NFR6_TRYRA|nr:Bem46-like serine peptidase [Trypanosoma rangeli]RNF05895.1 Bem46-like serine peptidase [Trypanosoma rangeli]|eukprot:RNF05895.1 Bem46-like serine peptidase [Trypanosoma rangeli]
MEALNWLVAYIFWMCAVVILFSVFLIVLSYILREKQNQFLYFPESPAGSTNTCESPIDRGFVNTDIVHIRTADGVTLRGFMMWPSPEQQLAQQSGAKGSCRGQNFNLSTGTFSPCGSMTPRDRLISSTLYVIIYFHGNAGNVGHRVPIATLFTTKHRCAVLMIDYRGFGLSDSVPPTEEGLKLDAQACLEYVWNHLRIPQGRIFVMGTSLGGAVAIHLASQQANMKRIAGVIVENTFTSVSDMASVLARVAVRGLVSRCPALWLCLFDYYVKPLCLRIGWRNLDLVERIDAPMLFLSGGGDEVVPAWQMQRLYAAAEKSKSMRRFVGFPEGKHNTLPLLRGYSEIVDEFVQDVLCLEAEVV